MSVYDQYGQLFTYSKTFIELSLHEQFGVVGTQEDEQQSLSPIVM